MLLETSDPVLAHAALSDLTGTIIDDAPWKPSGEKEGVLGAIRGEGRSPLLLPARAFFHGKEIVIAAHVIGAVVNIRTQR